MIETSRQWAAYNNTSSLALWKTLEYKLVDANGGIQKVRVEPATRSAVATCIKDQFYLQVVLLLFSFIQVIVI